MPVFYFALFRNQVTLRFPNRFRMLSLITALMFGLFVTWDLSSRIGSFEYYLKAMAMLDWGSSRTTSFLALARDPRTMNQVAILLSECSNIAYILLLVVFFRQSSGERLGEADVPAPRLFRSLTKIVVIVWGIWVAFNIVRLAAMPFLYPLLQSIALRTGGTPPPLGRWVFEAAQNVLTQACLFIAPYVVYNGWMRSDESTDGVQPVPNAPA